MRRLLPASERRSADVMTTLWSACVTQESSFEVAAAVDDDVQ